MPTLSGTLDISSFIHPLHYCELVFGVHSYDTNDLNFMFNVVSPIDVPISIHGWEVSNLQSSLIGGYGPNDIQAYINTIQPKDLSVDIKVFQGMGVECNLPVNISGFYINDLQLYLNAHSGVDLNFYLNSVGAFFDLSASIMPNVVYIKSIVNVSLLECSDLKAIINYVCFGSDYKDLGGYLHTIYKKDLGARIRGWFSTFDTGPNLGACINAKDYNVEDRLNVGFIPESVKYTLLNLSFSVYESYKAHNTIRLVYGDMPQLDLPMSIAGMPNISDLSVYINTVFEYDYSELPQWVSPKSHEVVIDLDKCREQYKRFVEIMFDTLGGRNDFHYFYVSAENKVYKVDKSRHWTIWAKSYVESSDNVVERTNLRHKYIFKMSDYSTVDEAVRDLIDRVSSYREDNLLASITVQGISYSNLGVSLNSKVVHSWVKHLKVNITGV